MEKVRVVFLSLKSRKSRSDCSFLQSLGLQRFHPTGPTDISVHLLSGKTPFSSFVKATAQGRGTWGRVEVA